MRTHMMVFATWQYGKDQWDLIWNLHEMIYVLFSFDEAKDFLPFSGSFVFGISAHIGSKAGAMDELVN